MSNDLSNETAVRWQTEKYLFIANKPDSDDYCKGCRMASYAGEHYMENWITGEKLVEKLADFLLLNKDMRCNEDGYEFLVFKKGVCIFDGSRETSCCCDLRDSYSESELESASDLIDSQEKIYIAEMTAMYEAAVEKVEEAIAKRNQTAKEQAKAKAAAAIAKATEERWKMHLKLKQEFEPQ